MRVLRGMGGFALLLVGCAWLLPRVSQGGLPDPFSAAAVPRPQVLSVPSPSAAPGMAQQAADLAGSAVTDVAKAAGSGVLSLVRTMDPRAIDALAALPVRASGTSAGYAPSAFGTSRDAGHAVPLATAWREGAAHWSSGRRAGFAQDPLNLAAKGANPCAAAARQIAVRSAYGLSVTSGERDALARVLITCPDEPLPQ